MSAENTSARNELAELLASEIPDDIYACSRVWEAWSYGTMSQDDFAPANEESDLIAEIANAILSAGYSKVTITGYAVLDRAGHMIGEQFTERDAAAEFAAEWTKDCKDAGIDWDYRVAMITEAAA